MKRHRQVAQAVQVEEEEVASVDAPDLASVDLDCLDIALVEPEPEPDGPQDVESLWKRVQMQLRFDIPEHSRIQAHKRWYLKHPEYMVRVAKRAEPFLYLMVEEIEKSGLPMDLVLLPIVESAFDPFAYSHGRASGMWQFVPATAKQFGLQQNWWYDGRRDVAASTRSAIAFLKYLHKRFDGNWLHALAAYNTGEGRVFKAIRNNKKAGKSTEFWALKLPRETRDYVPKLLALVDIVRNMEENKLKLHPIINQPVLAQVDIGSQIDLAYAADLADMSVRELHALNPGYNRWATAPEGPHTLLLPLSKMDAFSSALNDTSARERLNWVRYKIKSGDSLNKIANKYHTTVKVLQDINNLRGNTIRAGKHMLIPVAAKSLEQYSLSSDQRLASTKARKRGAQKLDYRVKNGDTLWDISRIYKVNVRQLAKWNGMAPTDPIKPGQKLVVWLDDIANDPTHKGIMRSVTYKVRSGDSLARIANKFKVKIADIERWNQLNRSKYLQPGQTLKLFIDVTKS